MHPLGCGLNQGQGQVRKYYESGTVVSSLALARTAATIYNDVVAAILKEYDLWRHIIHTYDVNYALGFGLA